MKNHIKNYIKIMGLAAVPFGTAQAEVVTIRVEKQELTEQKGARFIISKENEKGECLESLNIKWYDKDKYPVPIFHPNGKVSVTIPHEWVCDLLKGDKSKKKLSRNTKK